jgi:hypothetical protein
MAKFDRIFKGLFEKGEKIDPLGHKALKAIVKMDSKGVREITKGVDKLFGGDGENDLTREADKNVNDPTRAIGRAAATVGLLYGGAAALGSGGSTAAGGGMTAGASGPTGSGLALGASGGGTGAGLSTAGTVAGGEATSLGTTGLGSSGMSSGFSPQFQRLLSMRQQPQQPSMAPIEDVQVDDNPYIGELALSSKKAKKPAGSVDQAIERGARRENPIDTNGVQMAAIKVLNQRLKRIEAAAQQRNAR